MTRKVMRAKVMRALHANMVVCTLYTLLHAPEVAYGCVCRRVIDEARARRKEERIKDRISRQEATHAREKRKKVTHTWIKKENKERRKKALVKVV